MLDKKKIAIIVGGATVVVGGATALTVSLLKNKKKGNDDAFNWDDDAELDAGVNAFCEGKDCEDCDGCAYDESMDKADEDDDIEDEDFDDFDDDFEDEDCDEDFDEDNAFDSQLGNVDDEDEKPEMGCPFDEDIYADSKKDAHFAKTAEDKFKTDTPNGFVKLLKAHGVSDEKLLSDIEKATDAFGTATEKTCDASREVLVKVLKRALKALDK